MSSATGRRAARRGRRAVLLIAAIALIALLVPFSQFAVERWNRRSVVRLGDYASLGAAHLTRRPDDATPEWRRLFDRLPAPPVFDEPAPPGFAWDPLSGPIHQLDYDDVRRGPWSPAERPGLRRMIRTLDDPAMQSHLADMCALADRPFVIDVFFSDNSGTSIHSSEVRAAVKLLCSASRYFREERRDGRRAWECLRAALAISRGIEHVYMVNMLVGVACESLALSETSLWLLENSPDDGLLADMSAFVALPPDAVASWQSALRGERRLVLLMVNMCYTRGADGNGWLVLADQPDTYTLSFTGSVAPAARSRLWNLLSPIYDDRRTIEARIDRLFQRAESVVELPYRQAVARLDGLRTVEMYSAAAGPLLGQSPDRGHPFSTRTYQIPLGNLAQWRSISVLIALQRFHRVHHRYPAELRELVPEFLAALPDDPITPGQTFRYVHSDDGSIQLYSCGYNARDDGGKRDPSRELDDIDYAGPRAAPANEPRLVPVSEPDESAMDDQP
ncbi:MAG: hypothetical protein CHACPFDD_03381 [Phycisphaerae bacterium]|nr:hypothetical protein [Phycisphaerae bacterium]